jgi:hypothetical protein
MPLIFIAKTHVDFRSNIHALLATFKANATAGTSSSSFKIGGSGPTGVMLNGFIWVSIDVSHFYPYSGLIMKGTYGSGYNVS